MTLKEEAARWARKNQASSIEEAYMAGYKSCVNCGKRPIEERERDFCELVEQYRGKYPDEMLEKFVRYWTEKTPNGKKMLYETKVTFEVGRRLITWYERSSSSEQHGNGKSKARCGNSIFDFSNSVLQAH